MGAILQIKLLGGIKIKYNGAPVKGFERPRLQSLFAYLVLHPDIAHSRAHLAFTFWPDSTESQALTNLRKHLHFLRNTIPDVDQFIFADAITLGWRFKSPYSLDVLEFENAVAEADQAQRIGEFTRMRISLEQSGLLYQGDLLPDLYDDWVLSERERLHQKFAQALDRLIDLLESQREYATAASHAQRLLRADPVNETTYRHLMRLYALNGERATALRTYHTCATVLKRELGVDPSDATQEVYQKLLGGQIEINSPRELTIGMTPLVGRHLEWSQLRKSWNRAKGESPQCTLLSGEAGIGKTRLAEELLNWASRQGIPAALARCHESGADLAYTPLVTWLRTEPLRKKWSSLESVWLRELSQLLPEILIENQTIPHPSEFNQSWGQQRLFEALVRAFLSCRQALLILDDIHWCDPGTLDWLAFLFSRQEASDVKLQLLVVATIRSGDFEGENQLQPLLRDLRRSDRITEIELNPLSEAETAALARNTTGYDLSSAYLARLYQETEGNPLFVIETQRSGLDQQLPHRVQQVLKARLSQLSPGTRRLAGWAAAIGREFTFELLSGSSQEDEVTIVNALDELWRYRIIQEREERGYEFTHPLICTVATELISPVQKSFAHRQIAQSLERRLAIPGHRPSLPTAQALERLEQDINVQIAAHYEMAGLPAKSVLYYRRAADAAAQVYAWRQAIEHYRRGLGAVPDLAIYEPDLFILLKERIHLLEGLGMALELTGDHIQARQSFQVALNYLSGSDALDSPRLLHRLGDTYKSQGDYPKAAAAYDQAEAAWRQLEDPETPEARRIWLDLQFSRIFMHYGQGNAEAMLKLAAQIEEHIQRSGTPSQKAEFSLANSAVRCRYARYTIDADTIEFARKALQAYQEAGDLYGITEARFGLGFVRLWHGDLDQAEEDLCTCLAEARQIGKENLAVLCQAYLSTLHRIKGDPEQSKDFSLLCLEKAESLGMQTYAGLAQANLAWLDWKAGDSLSAWERAHTALDAWRGSVFPFQWTAHFLIIAMAVDQENVSEAIVSCKALLEPVQQKLPDSVNNLLSGTIFEWDRGNTVQVTDNINHLLAIIKTLRYT